MKVSEIKWVDGDEYRDKFGNVWKVSQQELRRINEKGNIEYITDGRFALGLLLCMDFEKIEIEKKDNEGIKKMTLGEFREFTKDLTDDFELRVSSILRNEKSYHTEILAISSSEDIEGKYIILEPSEIEVSDTDYEDD